MSDRERAKREYEAAPLAAAKERVRLARAAYVRAKSELDGALEQLKAELERAPEHAPAKPDARLPPEKEDDECPF